MGGCASKPKTGGGGPDQPEWPRVDVSTPTNVTTSIPLCERGVAEAAAKERKEKLSSAAIPEEDQETTEEGEEKTDEQEKREEEEAPTLTLAMNSH